MMQQKHEVKWLCQGHSKSATECWTTPGRTPDHLTSAHCCFLLSCLLQFIHPELTDQADTTGNSQTSINTNLLYHSTVYKALSIDSLSLNPSPNPRDRTFTSFYNQLRPRNVKWYVKGHRVKFEPRLSYYKSNTLRKFTATCVPKIQSGKEKGLFHYTPHLSPIKPRFKVACPSNFVKRLCIKRLMSKELEHQPDE